MKRGIIIACMIGLVAGLTAQAQETNAPPKHPGNGPARGGRNGPAMENLLPPRVVDELALTADQKTKYDALTADFKKDATKWRTDNNYDPAKAREEMRQARQTGDQATLKKLADQRKGLMDIRKGYVDKVRSFLTEEQKAKLDKSLERGRSMRGGPRPGGGQPPPPPPPAD